MDWYKDQIEPEVIDVVRLLRDNGFNTISSCGHKHWVETEWIVEGGLKILHDLLFNAGHRNYSITIDLEFLGGTGLRCFATLKLL
ncbi:hypothetical protein LCGC14_1546480 [marine sediment metagenome]|uniref:Uncharacterized protein n=1 Tax=marine sediment metagenome TaxID=412755 RepID=A0A0F9IRG7_9ZZZZ